MSGQGSPSLKVDASGLRVAVIAGKWHTEVMGGLIGGALASLDASGATHSLFEVAGAFELPLAAQLALTPTEQGGGGFDAAVCLGVIIRGGTPHFDFVANSVTDGLTRVQLDAGRPVGFGPARLARVEGRRGGGGRPACGGDGARHSRRELVARGTVVRRCL